MSFTIENLTPVIDATPGAVALGRLTIHNSTNTDADFTVRIVGLDGGDGGAEIDDATRIAVPANTSVDCSVPVAVPIDLATGQHAAAFQATSSRPTDRPLLAPFTVSVESVEQLNLVVEPATIRGRRRSKFLLGVGNGEPTPVAFTLEGDATDVTVRFKTAAFKLLPGQRATTRAKVRGPRHLVGEPIQHNLVIAARGKASATTITAPFIQRPFFARKLRAVVAALAVIALWLGAIGGVALWVADRNDGGLVDSTLAGDGAALVRLVDANGDVLANGPYTVQADGSVVDADGNPVDGFAVDANGNVVDDDGNPVNGVFVDDSGTLVDENGTPIGLPGGGGAGAGGTGGAGDAAAAGDDDPADPGASVPTSTVLRGTVSAENTADLSDVSVILTALDLGAAPPPDATVIDPPAPSESEAPPSQTSAGKVWSARQAPIAATFGDVRQTESVAPLTATPGVDGLWMIPDVPLRRTYELIFAKAGYDTQRFVIAPPDDGSPVEIDVTLLPASGVISGRVVSGGSPLGGVEIEISDGNLVFTTTSQTDGDVGAFAFGAISTPGIYTLTAARAGFGTEVLQLPMDAGQERTDVAVQMSAGVGTVSGSIVDERARPVPGAVVTASNGDITRTTNSLTDGRIGFYSIPQLDVPSTYIITVEAPGFLPQTRRVPMGGSIDGVGFELVNTTSRLTGVVSSAGGGGIAAAGVTLSNADLQFDVATSATPTRGAYAVDDLPPGNYTVTFDHFRHRSVTEFITIVEGVDPPPLDVTLPTRPLTIDAGTGSLVVEVIDPNAEDAGAREIEGATIRLVETRTGQERYRIDDAPSFTTEFSDVIVGTYTILVSAPGFNDAAPRQVSIGQSQERRTIEMLAFGAATGSMIDSITGEVVRGYTVRFFEQDTSGGAEREIRQAEVNVPASSPTGVWATVPRVLPAGIYRIEVSGAAGYREPTSQQLDPDLPAMQFRVLPLLDQATEIPVLVADRFPDISGRVYEPRLVAGTRTEFDPIDDASLTVTMACNGGPAVDVPTSDEFGVQGGGELDSFFLPRQAVDANNLIGACELEFAATGYVTQTVPVPNVVVSNGVTLSDRVVNAALVQPVDTFGGRVFWVDDRFATELPLVGVDIAADAITSMTPTDAGPPPPGQVPSTATTTITARSGTGGTWTLDGQIFGPARYTFTEPGFAPGQIDVVIDESRNRTVTPVGGVNLTQVGSTFDVELEPPNDGAIIGRVQLVTIDTPAFDDVGVDATDPFGNTTTDDPADPRCSDPSSGLCVVRTGGDFVVESAPAGTWTTDFTAPPNHVLFNGAPGSVEQLVGPAERRAGFDTSFVELGRLDVTAFDSVSGDEITTGATLRLSGGVNLDETFTAGAGPDGNRYSLDGIPVHPTNPLNIATDYTLEVIIAGYDSSAAQVRVDGNIIGSNATGIPLGFRAGAKPQIEVRLPQFGSIVASAVGQTEPSGPPTEALVLDPVTGPALDVTVVLVSQNGTPVPGFDPATMLVEPFGVDQFQVTGPPGYYRITVGHEEYLPTPTALPSDNCITAFADPNPCPPAPFVPGVYRLRNANANVLTGQFVLQLRPSSVRIETVDSLATGTPVTTAQYTLTRPGLTPDITGAVTGGDITLPDILPGTYRLEVRSFDPLAPGVDDAFPVITDIVVRRSTAATPALTSVRAPLPAIGASITGDVAARNSAGGPVPLPTITIDRDFVEPQIDVDGTLEDNDFTGEPGIPGDGPSATVPGATSDVATFNIVGLATGSHTLTFDEPAGYTATFDDDPADPAKTKVVDIVTAAGPTPVPGGTLVYTVDDITSVTATIQGADTREVFPNLVATLVPPGSTCADGGTVGTSIVNANSVTVTFANVPPHRDAYTLCTTDDLHTDFTSQPLIVPVVERDVNDLSTHFLGTFSPTAEVARIEGELTQLDNGTVTPLVNPATLTLLDASLQVVATVDDPGPSYLIDVPAASGSYTVRLSKPGYAPTEGVLSLFQGRTVRQDLEVVDLVSFSVTITNDPVPVGTTVTIVRTNGQVFPTTQAGSLFTAQVPAGSYRIEARINGTNVVAVEPPNGSITASAGTTVTRSIELPRTLTVNVTGANNNTTVRVFSGATQVASRTLTSNASSKTFTFLTGPGADAIPAEGALTLLVTDNGRRPVGAAVPAGYEPSVGVNLLRLVDVEGRVSIGGTPVGGGVTVTASAPGFTSVTDDTSGGGASVRGFYDIPNLGIAADASTVTWTLSVDEIGLGSGSTTLDISSGAPPASVTGQDITLTPALIPVNITVVDSRDDTPIVGASVTLGAATATTGPTGVATFDMPENANSAARTYSASATDFVSSGTTSLPAITGNRNARDVTVSLDVQRVTVRFEVRGTPSNDLVEDAIVVLTGFGSDDTNSSGIASFSNVPVDAGPVAYTVTGPATFGSASGTLSDIRTVPDPVAVQISDPPPPPPPPPPTSTTTIP
ncbi:MAG: carboxypeptidase regulatory-like domain-containing protein [Ilumatobacter sp.]|uniref:carboxypeptidase regulatory-like domain-containing protein n=1 Tax=Ilumatobacter sp. TaxID=1967498 RepID=UPI00391BEBFA